MRIVLSVLSALVLVSLLSVKTPAASGVVITGNIDHTNRNQTADGDIHVTGKIDGGSQVTLVSNSGSIIIDGKIDGGSHVTLKAARNVRIGAGGRGGDYKIDGQSKVSATAGGRISLGDKIDGCTPQVFSNCTGVDFIAGTGIDIGGKIDGGVRVQLKTGRGKIHIHGKIDGGSGVTYWPGDRLVVDGGVQRCTCTARNW